MENHHDKDRRKTGLTDDELDAITERVIEKLEADMGRRGFKAILWILGILITIFLTWLSTKISLHVDP